MNLIKYKGLRILLFLIAALIPLTSQAHVNNSELENMSGPGIFIVYLELGFTHIIPLGFDHILFIISLFLLSPKLKTIFWQATAFTLAHSITLGLAMYGIISAPSYIIEPIIALSIMFVALENMITEKLQATRILIVFGFGLIHGLGFADVLMDLGLPQKDFVNALISFNIGVELGQFAIILLCWFLFGKWFNQKPWYRSRIVYPLSGLIALIALYWTIERAFFN